MRLGRVECRLEGQDALLQCFTDHVGSIQVCYGAGLHLGEPAMGHTWSLLAWEAQSPRSGIHA